MTQQGYAGQSGIPTGTMGSNLGLGQPTLAQGAQGVQGTGLQQGSLQSQQGLSQHAQYIYPKEMREGSGIPQSYSKVGHGGQGQGVNPSNMATTAALQGQQTMPGGYMAQGPVPSGQGIQPGLVCQSMQGMQGQGIQGQYPPGQGMQNQGAQGQWPPGQVMQGMQGMQGQGIQGQYPPGQVMPGMQGMQGMQGQGIQGQYHPGQGIQGMQSQGFQGQWSSGQVMPGMQGMQGMQGQGFQGQWPPGQGMQSMQGKCPICVPHK